MLIYIVSLEGCETADKASAVCFLSVFVSIPNTLVSGGVTGESQSTANNKLPFHETVNSTVFSHLSDPQRGLIKLTWF